MKVKCKALCCSSEFEKNNSEPIMVCRRDIKTIFLLKSFGVNIEPMDGICPKIEMFHNKITPVCWGIPEGVILQNTASGSVVTGADAKME